MPSHAEKYTVTDSTTLLEFLATCYPQSSKSGIKKMIIHGSISVNRKVERNPAEKVKKGDEISYQRNTMVARPRAPFRLLFEDGHIIVIEKPAGLLTYGERGTTGTSAYKEMKDYLASYSTGKPELFVVHRLDREVSGILLFARSEEIQEKLKDNWKEFTKKYQALVEGVIEEEEGEITSWLSDDRAGFKVYSGREREGARYAETKWRVLKVLEEYTLVELQLVTGRKNQIRVHLSDLGHPVVGDRKYGADATFKRRIRLHGFYLRIRHPQTNEWLEFRSELPRGFLVLNPKHENYK